MQTCLNLVLLFLAAVCLLSLYSVLMAAHMLQRGQERRGSVAGNGGDRCDCLAARLYHAACICGAARRRCSVPRRLGRGLARMVGCYLLAAHQQRAEGAGRKAGLRVLEPFSLDLAVTARGLGRGAGHVISVLGWTWRFDVDCPDRPSTADVRACSRRPETRKFAQRTGDGARGGLDVLGEMCCSWEQEAWGRRN